MEVKMKKKAKVISCTLQKGGVGKTMFAVNIASCLSVLDNNEEKNRKNKVLLVDMDPHSSTTKYLAEYDDDKPSVYDVLVRRTNIKDAIVTKEYFVAKHSKKSKDTTYTLDLLRSNEILHHLESQWQHMETPEFRLVNSINEVIFDYDYIIIDCSPGTDPLLRNAFNATDYYIIPVLPDANSFQELAPTVSQIKTLTTISNPGKILGCVLNRYWETDRITVDDTSYDMKELYGQVLDVFNTSIHNSESIDYSFFINLPTPFVYLTSKKCSSIYFAFKRLTLEILNKIEKEELSNA